MFRAFLGCSWAEFLFFRGKSENIMISRKKGKNFDMFGIIFCYLHLIIGNLLKKLWKYHSFQGVTSLYPGNVGKFGWGRIFTCQGIFGLFLQNIYPWVRVLNIFVRFKNGSHSRQLLKIKNKILSIPNMFMKRIFE